MASKKQTTLTMMTFGKPASAGFQLFTLCAILFNSLLIASSQDTLYEGDPCTFKDGRTGVCAKVTSCKWFIDNFIKKGRYEERVSCTFVGNTEVICCKPQPGFLARLACDGVREIETRLVFNIIGGEAAEEGEFPFMAALGYNNDEVATGYDYQCGASLISENFLLTAAHCLAKSDLKPEVALLGTTFLRNTDHAGVEVKIKNMTTHPKYRRGQSYNDIALIELERRLVTETDVSPICLHTGTEDLPGTVVLTAEGFGITDDDQQSRSAHLLKVNLTTVPLADCIQSFENNGQFDNNKRLPRKLIETQYCATGQKNLATAQIGDTCQGDSGGPLQMREDEKYKLVGVTSFGAGCGSGTPSVYTRVGSYIEWIEDVVWWNGGMP